MDAAQHEPTCRVRRHAHVQHVLAADETSLVELDAVLATLPICASGRVFVEVSDAAGVGVLDAPARMVVSWFDRSVRGGRPGDALTRAVTAWADEMLCESADTETRVLLFGVPAASAAIVAHLTGRLDLDPDAIRVLAPVV